MAGGPWALRIDPAPMPAAAAQPGEHRWQDFALCAEIGDDGLWFPEKGGSTVQAKLICAACPVRSECLSYALEHGEKFGIWGGLSERERHRLKRQAA